MKYAVAILGAVFLALFLSAPVFAAAESIGAVKTSAGLAQIVRAGETLPTAVGDPVFQNDVLLTGADGAMGVTFVDSTMLSVGPNTELTIDEYVFEPKDNNYSFAADMARGTLQFISGEIAKLSKDSVTVKIPTGTIAVRGTRFLVKVADPSTLKF